MGVNAGAKRGKSKPPLPINIFSVLTSAISAVTFINLNGLVEPFNNMRLESGVVLIQLIWYIRFPVPQGIFC